MKGSEQDINEIFATSSMDAVYLAKLAKDMEIRY